MSLNASNFVSLGPIKSVDLRQFVDLFTGVMTDQPVTFKNAVVVGGSQGSSTAPLKLVGVNNQTGNLIELYPTVGSPTPTFGFGALGNFAWGPATPGANDTFLSRVAQQNGHVTDTAGLLVEPYLEVKGQVRADGWTFTNGATVTSPTANPFTLVVNQTLTMNNVNQRIRAMPAANVGIAMDSLDGYAEIAGSNAFMGANVFHDGAHWNRINNAVAVATLAVGPGSLNYYTAPAAAGQDPPWAPVFTVDAAGNATVAGAFSANVVTARGRNIFLPDANCYIVSDTNNNLFIRSVALYVQTNTGAAAPLVAGNVTATNATFNGDIIANNITLTGNAFVYGAANNGVVYFEASNAVYIAWRADLGALYIPYGNGIYTSTVLAPRHDWESGRNVYMIWDGTNVTMNMAGPWGFATPNLFTTTLHVGQAVINSPNVNNVHIVNANLSLEGNRIIQLNSNSGGAAEECSVSPGTNIGHSGAVYLSPHAYVFFDLGVGHVVTCQQVIQTSDPSLKSGSTLFDDAACMARIRDTSVHVYSYQMDAPTPPPGDASPVTPTPNNIGMMAPEVYASSPEFAALNGSGAAVGVNYSNMAAMLWGALRQLDARCVAKGI